MNSVTNIIKALWEAMTRTLSAEELAMRELDQAKREHLQMLTALDYSKRMVDYHQDRIKRLTALEVIVDAVHLTCAWRSRGAGNNVMEGLAHWSAAQLVDDGVFAHPTWARDHDHLGAWCPDASLWLHHPSPLLECNRSASRGACRSAGSSASSRMRRPSRGCAKTIFHA